MSSAPAVTRQVVKQGSTLSGVSKVAIAPALLDDFSLSGAGLPRALLFTAFEVSAGGKLIKIVITASSKAAKTGSLFTDLRRASAPSTRASATFHLGVK